MIQVNLSEQTKAALAAYARDINTPLEYRIIEAEFSMWLPHDDSAYFFFNVCEYRVKPAMEVTPHANADIIMAFIADPTVEIQFRYPDDIDWHVMDTSLMTFYSDVLYEIVPKKGQ